MNNRTGQQSGIGDLGPQFWIVNICSYNGKYTSHNEAYDPMLKLLKIHIFLAQVKMKILWLYTYVALNNSQSRRHGIDSCPVPIGLLRHVLATDLDVGVNPLECRGNYSATLNNMSWHTGRWWVGCYIWYSEERTGRDRSLPRPLLAVPKSTHQRPVYQSSYCCILVRYSAVLMCP